MAITIVATAGSESANSYATVAEADAYLEPRLNSSAWDDAAAETQKAALVEATREMDLLPWRGTRVDLTQALAWPREDVPIPDLPDDVAVGSASSEYSTTAIPDRIRDMTIELALEFLRAGTTDLSKPDPELEKHRKRTDVLETEFVPYHQRRQGIARFPRIWARIYPLLDPSKVGGRGWARV